MRWPWCCSPFPIFHPVITELHYDPIWFGVMIVVVTQMGVISPPVGVCVYVVSGIERDVPLQTVFQGARFLFSARLSWRPPPCCRRFRRSACFCPAWPREESQNTGVLSTEGMTSHGRERTCKQSLQANPLLY